MIKFNQLLVLGSLSIILTLISNGAYAEVITCKSDKLNVCFEGNCEDRNAITTFMLDTKQNNYQRCDTTCDTYNIKAMRSGIFLVASPTIGTFIKINELNKSFVDVASMMTEIYVNSGTCKSN
jgi:hypothetical protein